MHTFFGYLCKGAGGIREYVAYLLQENTDRIDIRARGRGAKVRACTRQGLNGQFQCLCTEQLSERAGYYII